MICKVRIIIILSTKISRYIKKESTVALLLELDPSKISLYMHVIIMRAILSLDGACVVDVVFINLIFCTISLARIILYTNV